MHCFSLLPLTFGSSSSVACTPAAANKSFHLGEMCLIVTKWLQRCLGVGTLSAVFARHPRGEVSAA